MGSGGPHLWVPERGRAVSCVKSQHFHEEKLEFASGGIHRGFQCHTPNPTLNTLLPLRPSVIACAAKFERDTFFFKRGFYLDKAQTLSHQGFSCVRSPGYCCHGLQNAEGKS